MKLNGQWDKQDNALTRGEDGVWSSAATEVPTGIWEYSFQVDGPNVEVSTCSLKHKCGWLVSWLQARTVLKENTTNHPT